MLYSNACVLTLHETTAGKHVVRVTALRLASGFALAFFGFLAWMSSMMGMEEVELGDISERSLPTYSR